MAENQKKRIKAIESKSLLNDRKIGGKFEKLLCKAVDEALKFAVEVFTSKAMIEVKQYTKEGSVKKTMMPLYTPDHKIRVFEKLADKVFADKRHTELVTKSGDDNPMPLNVAGFSFVPVKVENTKESE